MTFFFGRGVDFLFLSFDEMGVFFPMWIDILSGGAFLIDWEYVELWGGLD
jgi:hypothetical protein